MNQINFAHAQYENVPCKKNGPHSRAFEEMDDTSKENELKAFASLFNVELINELDSMRHRISGLQTSWRSNF